MLNLIWFLAGTAAVGVVEGCTNILVSKGASADGSTQIAYNADSENLYGSLAHYPAATHPPGTTRDIWDWDDSVFLGTIPEAATTYNVVGNINDQGLIIGETTFGGLPELNGAGTGQIMDYGSLIWVTLQRAKTAREAIKVMDSLTQQFGYASDGESFSIADKNEVWLMEMIGKGKFGKGSVWVAAKVPDGMVGSTANQARITKIDFDSPSTYLYSDDVVTFAQANNFYPAEGKKEDFSFSEVYDPITFSGARLGEARVYNLYSQIAGDDTMRQYLDYAQGYNLTNRMPLFVTPQKKLSVNDTMWHMRTHFEGTWFDNSGTIRPDVGAGPGASVYRWRPLVWEYKGAHYVNERTVGTQQTAWNFVAQSRPNLPAPIAALIWWSPDDSATGVRIPVYAGVTRIPPSFGDPVGQEPAAATSYGVKADAFTMSMDSAFWVWNLVANMAYQTRYAEVYPIIQEKIAAMENELFKLVEETDAKASEMYTSGEQEKAIEYLTNFTCNTGEATTKQYRDFWMYLFARFRDGCTNKQPVAKQCDVSKGEKTGCTSRAIPDSESTGYTENWYGRIVSDSDNAQHFRVPDGVFTDIHNPNLENLQHNAMHPYSNKHRLVELNRHKLNRMNKGKGGGNGKGKSERRIAGA